MTRRCALLLLLLLLGRSPGALARSTAGPPRLTHKALANGVVGLLRANRHPANLRARLDRTSRYLMRKVADTKTWKPNPKLRFKSFKSFEEYRAYADRCNKTCKSDFSHNTLALVDVDAGGKKQRLVVLDPGLTGLGRNKLMITVQGDHMFFTNEYQLGTREMKSRAVQLDPKSGKVLKVKDKLDYLLDQYPHDKVVLTRTMAFEERKKWDNPRTRGSALGSSLMAMMMGTPYKHLCFGTGGYWNDYAQFWQDHVQLKVSKEEIRSWVKQGKAYITPLGADFFTRTHEARVLADPKVSLPFEFTAIDPGLNKQLLKAYQRTGTDADLVRYKQKGDARARNTIPLGAMSLNTCTRVWNHNGAAGDAKQTEFYKLKSMPDSAAKNRRVYKLTQWVVNHADDRLRGSEQMRVLQDWLRNHEPAR